jgi:oligopeptide/dipeptide ABC transporter ATP-binding protein
MREWTSVLALRYEARTDAPAGPASSVETANDRPRDGPGHQPRVHDLVAIFRSPGPCDRWNPSLDSGGRTDPDDRKIVEIATTATLFDSPAHPYTEALLSAVPVLDPRLRARRIVLEGDVADPAHPPPGCDFHPRCRYATERCRSETPRQEEFPRPRRRLPPRPRTVARRHRRMTGCYI